jgi:DNA repair protein RecN (Recombination protein N)
MCSELALLGMPEARFLVAFDSLAPGLLRGASEVLARAGRALGPDGVERVEFQLAANPGEGPRPLARVASGGELSRLMLALRSLAGHRGAPTLVFDEVDAGIGGATAELVGRRLRDLARKGQVICITHLAQIAAYADLHYAVRKSHDHGRTRSDIRLVDGDERVAELARMLGGDRSADVALRHAREILRRSREHEDEGPPLRAPRARAARRGGR